MPSLNVLHGFNSAMGSIMYSVVTDLNMSLSLLTPTVPWWMVFLCTSLQVTEAQDGQYGCAHRTGHDNCLSVFLCDPDSSNH